MHALVTGAAGFIGSNLADGLLDDGWKVTAVDNFDGFYSPTLKQRNIIAHQSNPKYRAVNVDIRDFDRMRGCLTESYDVIVHLAAKAGVRPSIENPRAYQETNVIGTQNMLELAKLWSTPQFVFASSSSVYGVNPNVPWAEEDQVLMPISPYASTKVSGELLGHVYAHLYGIRFAALRFFTVYGPRQRPDLAIHKFASLICAGNPIPIYGDGSTSRDYTYISDIVSGIRAAMCYRDSPYEVFNLGNSSPITLLDLINTIGLVFDKVPVLQFLPMQPGDVPRTWADVSKAQRKLNYIPQISMQAGLQYFASWFNEQPEH